MRVGIVGGGFAGRMAAVGLRGKGHEVVLVDARPSWVERTRLHEAAALARPVERDHGELTSAIGATFRQARVTAVESGWIRTTEGAPEAVDAVVVAAGSVMDRSVPGVREHALALGSPEEAAAIHAHLAGLGEGADVVVVGAGLTGLELATEVAGAFGHLRVTLVGDPRQGLSARGVRAVERRLEALGIVQRVGRVHEVTAAGLETDQGRLPADLVLWAAGFRAPAWLREAGLPLDATGRIAVDASLMVRGRPMVVAAGDCAGTNLVMACATAMPMGIHAARVLHGVSRGAVPRPLRVGYLARCISLGREDAVIQRTVTDGAPAAQVLRGRLAVGFKEAILRAAAGVPGWEATAGMGLFAWPDGPPVVSEAAGAAVAALG